MDALYPYLQRATPASPAPFSLISPVIKYSRIANEDKQQHQQRIGWRLPSRQQQASSHQHADPHQTQAEPEIEKPLLATCHAVTPEALQHADAEGHLDIYI